MHLYAAAALGLLVVGLFADLLFADPLALPSHAQGDTARWYVWMRLFGYSELQAGNLALWNPHTFAGMPFVGTFQSAIFYPPNLIYLIADLRTSLIAEFGLHLFVLGFTTFVWLRARGHRGLSALVASVVVIFGSTVMLRVLAGQLSVLETFAWWPLLLRAIDGLGRRVEAGLVLLGVGAVSLMILAGHPPTVLQAGVATALYAAPIVWRSDDRLRLAFGLSFVAVGPLLLTAVQLTAGLHTAAESLRRAGMSYAFSVSHSFPPEQLLTLLAPDFFGNADRFNLTYFGRVFYWDATYFVGIGGLMLALHGAFARGGRDRRTAIILTIGLAVIAMGGYTPVYRVFYELVPGMSFARAPSKFLFFSSVFLAWLAAMGTDALLIEERTASHRRTATIAAGLGVLAAALAAWAAASPVSLDPGAGPMASIMSLTRNPDYVVEGVAADWHRRLLSGAVQAACVAAVFAALFGLLGRDRRLGFVIVALVIAELGYFAFDVRGTTRMTIDQDLRQDLVSVYARAGRDRVQETAASSNIALGRRQYAMWGYDPVMLGRYIEFVVFTQGGDWREIRKPTRVVPYKPHPLYAMLRTRFRQDWKSKQISEYVDVLPRFLFVDDYVVRGRDEVLDAIGDEAFDPRNQVVLEIEPKTVSLTPSASGAVPSLWTLDESTDHVDLEIELDRASILVVTDAYSEGWRATPLDGSDQEAYEVLPANYVLRAIPLAAGHHRLRLEYLPEAVRLGRIVSMVSLAIFLVACAVWSAWRGRILDRIGGMT